jgi:hypothetical protein
MFSHLFSGDLSALPDFEARPVRILLQYSHNLLHVYVRAVRHGGGKGAAAMGNRLA